MNFQKASDADFYIIQEFYWDVIDNVHKNNIENKNLGWEKGVYPSDAFIKSSLANEELYILTENDVLYACVILNSNHNEGYEGCPWSIVCNDSEVLTPHALAVSPKFQGKGIGKIVVENILNIAKTENKKSVRLDIIGACKEAERLYISCGFHFVEAKDMFYEDTGWTEFKMFELNL